jgi:tetratricopeptide (TPR) repeat protein
MRVLDRDPNHAKVLQQLGWLHHQQSTSFSSQEQAIEYLEKSVNSDQTDAQSWYLLGRCYMSQQKYPKAYEAYQQAVYRDGRNPTFWCSIGVLYYQINQYRDALDAYSRAIRLNPNISEVWYDLGTSRPVWRCSRVNPPTVCPTKQAHRFLKMCLLRHISQVLWVLAHPLLSGELLLRVKLKLLSSLLQAQTGRAPTVLPTFRTLRTLVLSPKC